MRLLAAALLVLTAAQPALAQIRFRNRIDLGRVNRHLAGQIVDYTHNHGEDRRLPSALLGMPRDVYVYLPPDYNPAIAYPLLVYLHMGYVDEHTFAGSRHVHELDRMILRGDIPPLIVVVPDGTHRGENRTDSTHSFFINGLGGPFEEFLMRELLPFVMSRYSVRPEREAHALFGASAGGFGALNLALKHREFFSVVATLAAPANIRYTTTTWRGPRGNFDAETFRLRNDYDPNEVIGRFYLGLSRVRASKYIEPVFGADPEAVRDRIAQENPADLLHTTDLKPGELAIYLNYPGHDNYNFDAQAESFAWLAARRGVCVTLDPAPLGTHTLPYFLTNHKPAFRWIGEHLIGPCQCRPEVFRVSVPAAPASRPAAPGTSGSRPVPRIPAEQVSVRPAS